MTTETLSRNAELAGQFKIITLDEANSTNQQLREEARTGAKHGTVLWARKQTEGRGRNGRSWESPAGGLYASLLLRPGKNPAQIAQLSFVAAVSAHKALASILCDGVASGEVRAADADIRLKWPNDILLNGRKLGGILLESSIEGGKVDWVILGLGVNIERYPEGCEFPATSLAAAGVTGISAKIVLSRFLYSFAEDYAVWSREGFTPFRQLWLHQASFLGELIQARTESGTQEGIFEDLDEEGALVLRTRQGEIHRITCGDVFGIR